MAGRSVKTPVIYSFKQGALGQHPNTNRGAAEVNFVTAEAEGSCADSSFTSLHGALMLIAWMFFAPIGIYYVRYLLCMPSSVRIWVTLSRQGLFGGIKDWFGIHSIEGQKSSQVSLWLLYVTLYNKGVINRCLQSPRHHPSFANHG